MRTIFRVSPLMKLLRVAAFALCAVPALGVLSGSSPVQAEEASADIAVGTQLVATRNVQLHQAEIVKGSKVSVTNLARRMGQIESVDVELADGHVVPKVGMITIRSAFRVAE
jgi:hypothetical protein